MSKRNTSERADNLLKRASANPEYTERERVLMAVIADMMKHVPFDELQVIIKNEHIKCILDRELELKRKESVAEYNRKLIEQFDSIAKRFNIRMD